MKRKDVWYLYVFSGFYIAVGVLAASVGAWSPAINNVCIGVVTFALTEMRHTSWWIGYYQGLNEGRNENA